MTNEIGIQSKELNNKEINEDKEQIIKKLDLAKKEPPNFYEFNAQNQGNYIVQEFGLDKNDYIFLSIGKLNKNQNQIIQIDAIRRLKFKYPEAKLLIVGEGNLKEYYHHIIEKYILYENIKLMGDNVDISSILKLCDCVLSTSKAEGLSTDIKKAIMSNKPIIATSVRGHIDLLQEENLLKSNKVEELTEKMEQYIIDKKQNQTYNIEKMENQI